jgi:hypothetical protein
MAKPVRSLKKDHTILVRVEEDVDEFLQGEAAGKRVSKAQVVRDALYRFMTDRQKEKG